MLLPLGQPGPLTPLSAKNQLSDEFFEGENRREGIRFIRITRRVGCQDHIHLSGRSQERIERYIFAVLACAQIEGAKKTLLSNASGRSRLKSLPPSTITSSCSLERSKPTAPLIPWNGFGYRAVKTLSVVTGETIRAIVSRTDWYIPGRLVTALNSCRGRKIQRKE